MTLGEKLRTARNNSGISQAALAKQIHVSRQAVSKWEADRGVPDIENLQILARVFGMSLDELLDQETGTFQTREPLDTSKFTRGNGARSRTDSAVRAHFPPQVGIQPLIRRKKMTIWESAIDFIVQPGVVPAADSLRDLRSYYLIENDDRHYLACLDGTHIKTELLAAPFLNRKMVIGGNAFIKANYRLHAN